jgi:hypothetical protein
MSQFTVTQLYRYVVDEVIKNIKPEFENEGLDEQVLHDVQEVLYNFTKM